MTLGIVAKLTLLGFGSEPRKPSHSSVTITVTMMSVLSAAGFNEARELQRHIMGLMWPRPGNGSATTWLVVIGEVFGRLIGLVLGRRWKEVESPKLKEHEDKKKSGKKTTKQVSDFQFVCVLHGPNLKSGPSHEK